MEHAAYLPSLRCSLASFHLFVPRGLSPTTGQPNRRLSAARKCGHPGVDAAAFATYNDCFTIRSGGYMYALIRTGGKQYRVSPGDRIEVESLPGKVGDSVEFGEVLAVRTEDKMITGKAAAQASVSGKIVSRKRGPKLTVLKFKSNNQYKIQRGHRQNLTSVEVGEIKL